MSEKQFYIFEDNIRGNFGEVDKPLNNTEVVDLLNEQQATIRKLQDLCGESDSENAKLRIENKRLQEENKQLKCINNQINEGLIDEEMTNMECLMLLIPFGILFVLLTGIIIAFLVQLGWVVI